MTVETKIIAGEVLTRYTNPDGSQGGWVSPNVTITGDVWVSDEACVYGEAIIYGKAKIYGAAHVHGCAVVNKNAEVFENAEVYGNSVIRGYAKVYGDAKIYGKAKIHGDASVYGHGRVYENGEVSGIAEVYGDAEIYGDTQVHGDTHVTLHIMKGITGETPVQDTTPDGTQDVEAAYNAELNTCNRHDPRFEENGEFWFWNETWSEKLGPFTTLRQCTEAFEEYCKELLGQQY